MRDGKERRRDGENKRETNRKKKEQKKNQTPYKSQFINLMDMLSLFKCFIYL